jgi:putative colanic acid biosynthesis glycosyltransferase
MNRPIISIITTVYNACNTLEATIESVISQENELFEYWIIDGGSQDGSINIIQKYEKNLAGWISEPDKGIFDAMNKGVNLANGEWIYFLGGDDILQPGILKQILPYLIEPYKIVFGDVIFDNKNIMKSFLGVRTLLQNTLHHQSAFYRSSLFEDFQYDCTLFIQADYELNLRTYIQDLPVKYVPLLIATYALGGTSAGHSEKSLNEINIIRSRNLKNSWQNVFLSFLLRMYYTQKQIRFWLYGHQV